MSRLELIIQNGEDIYYPVVKESVKISIDRHMTPGKCTFTVMNDNVLNITEGNAVRVKWDNKPMFYGFIFSMKESVDEIQITAYDQLRYLKNKDLIIYKNLEVGGLIELITEKFNLQIGEIAKTGYILPPRIEDGVTLADMIKSAQDETLRNTSQIFCVYDNFGKITMKNMKDLRIDLYVDDETAQDVSISTSIDSNTYNQILLYRDNEDTGDREIYPAQDVDNINRWGVLQLYEELKEGENGASKADALLKLYNQKARSFPIKGIPGDTRVIGGSSFVVNFTFPGKQIKTYMVVDKVTHVFENNFHSMDLEMVGGFDG